ncbi:MAG TPA: hypothetical protein IGR89_07885, partial [Oscillatoriaceae cyanobacterium M7585_C2015_266]|nr:hypothetical protein [Oscillatoriaceae cyanobacterium M7585_C2015_266]
MLVLERETNTVRRPGLDERTRPNSSSVGERVKPKTLPPIQVKIRNTGGQRTVELAPPTPARVEAINPRLTQPQQVPSNRNTSFSGRYPQGITEADVEGAAIIGKFVLGVYDQITGRNTSQLNNYENRVRQRQVFTPLENLSYDAGRRFIDGGQKALEDIQTTTQQITRQAWEN